MHRLEPLPDHIIVAFENHGIEPSDVVLCAATDLDRNGNFAEEWLVATREKLCFLSGETISPPQRMARRSNHRKQQWRETGYREIALADMEELKADTLNGNGVLMATVKGQPEILCRYSNTMSRKFGQVTRLVSKLMEDKELTDADFTEEVYRPTCPTCGLLYPDSARQVCPKCLDRRALFLRVLSFLPKYKKEVTLILLCMLASSGMQIASPYLGGRILFDEVLTPGGRYSGQLLPMLLLMAALQLLSVGLSICYGRVNAGLTARVVFDLKTQVFAAMQRLSLGFFTSRETGNLMTRVNQDAIHLQYFFHDGFPYFIVNAVNLTGVMTVMIIMNWRLALLVLIPVPIIIYAVRNVFPKLWSVFSRRHRRTSALNSMVNDSLTGIRVVKAFGKEETETRRFAARNKDVFAINMRAGYITSTLFPAMSFVMNVGGLIVWSVGGWDVLTDRMSFGTLWTFIGYLGMLYGPLEFMTHIVDWWSSCMNSAQRIFEILDAVPDVAEKIDAISIPRIEGRIEMENVVFGYEPGKPVLKDITLSVEPGEMLGVIGYSGAGKSTLANLISRLYDPQEGCVKIDGHDVRDLRIADLRNQIGMVLQETFLFAGTIAENVAYAKPDATVEDIIQACKVAQAHDFIVKLPNGYETMIGHRGQNLSGGERQRLAIARAILHNPRILILDEATASVDTETEQGIQEGLERLVEGRTTIAIAHRLSTLRNADKLVVMDKGKIVEMGTHEELLELKGHYYKMLENQRQALKIRGVDVSEQELAGRRVG